MTDEKKFPTCFDPYFRYAVDSSAAFCSCMNMAPETLPLSLLVKLAGASAEDFRKALIEKGGDQVRVGPTEDSVPFVTVRMPAAMAMSEDWIQFWEEHASNVTLSLPVDAPRTVPERGLEYDDERPRSNARTIIGIMDDGCAFAHARLRRARLKTRIFAIWDQERGREPIEVSPEPLRTFGRRPADFDYGLEFWRYAGKQVSLDDWIAMHATPAGQVDEDRCYARAGFVSLRRRETHGSHVTDVLAGWVPTKARLSVDRKTPPSFNRNPQERWADADIVFVQIPQDAVNDASGKWLRTQVVDGLRYILSCAGPKTERVVFNLSYGRTTGPHDGTDALEEFLTDMVSEFDGRPSKPALEVVLPAGNSRAAACHVVINSSGTKQWTWRVPPDNTVPVMAEVRVRNSQAQFVTTCRLDPPATYVGQQARTVRFEGAHDTQWVMIVPPTRPSGPTPASEGPALHGDWTITVECSSTEAEVHAYVARTDPNMGARPGAKQSRFIDPGWELSDGAAASQRVGTLPTDKGVVRVSGTLSGIATANTPRVYVTGGYCISDKRSAPYSSAGPSRGARQSPDYALPTDETRSLAGIPGAGTRSGCVFRLVGTSTAAPQLARLLCGPSRPEPSRAVGALQDRGTAGQTLDPP